MCLRTNTSDHFLRFAFSSLVTRSKVHKLIYIYVINLMPHFHNIHSSFNFSVSSKILEFNFGAFAKRWKPTINLVILVCEFLRLFVHPPARLYARNTFGSHLTDFHEIWQIRFRLDCQLGSGPFSPDAPRPYLTGLLCPILDQGSHGPQT